MKHFVLMGTGLDIAPAKLALKRADAMRLWDKYAFRQKTEANKETQCILMRYQNAPQLDLYHANLNDGSDDHAWRIGLECFDTLEYSLLPEFRPLVAWVMARTGADRLGRVLLAKLPPDKRVYTHDDRGLYVDYYTRIVIPITVHQPGNVARIGDEFLEMNEGEAWTYAYEVEHEAVNNTPFDRVHLFVDVRLPSAPIMELQA